MDRERIDLSGFNAVVWGVTNAPVMVVNSGALINGPGSTISYRGATLTNNGTINLGNLRMAPDPGQITLNGTGSI